MRTSSSLQHRFRPRVPPPRQSRVRTQAGQVGRRGVPPGVRPSPGSVDAYGELSLELSRLGQHEEAEAAIRGALRLAPRMRSSTTHSVPSSARRVESPTPWPRSTRHYSSSRTFPTSLQQRQDPQRPGRLPVGDRLVSPGPHGTARPSRGDAQTRAQLERTGALDEAIAIARNRSTPGRMMAKPGRLSAISSPCAAI